MITISLILSAITIVFVRFNYILHNYSVLGDKGNNFFL
jgi:hypothetical protein